MVAPDPTYRRSIDIGIPDPEVMHPGLEPLNPLAVVARGVALPVLVPVMVVAIVAAPLVPHVVSGARALVRFVRWVVNPDAGRWV